VRDKIIWLHSRGGEITTEDDGRVAAFDGLTGVKARGESEEEAINNLIDAIEQFYGDGR